MLSITKRDKLLGFRDGVLRGRDDVNLHHPIPLGHKSPYPYLLSPIQFPRQRHPLHRTNRPSIYRAVQWLPVRHTVHKKIGYRGLRLFLHDILSNENIIRNEFDIPPRASNSLLGSFVKGCMPGSSTPEQAREFANECVTPKC